MPAPNKALTLWLSQSTSHEIKQLAQRAKTSVAQLRHIAHGRRAASAALAQRIAHASEMFPYNVAKPLLQTQLCEACGQCPLAKILSEIER